MNRSGHVSAMTRMLLGTPTYDNRVHSTYALSLLDLKEACRGIELVPCLTAGTVIEKQRNAMATRVLTDASFTHLLFVDSDMGFRPSLIEKMLAFDHPVVGCLYPWRGKDKFVEEASIVPGIAPVSGFFQVRLIGCGVMLVQRRALELMRERMPEIWATSAEDSPYRAYPWCASGVLQCFSSVQQHTGWFLSEDAAFCARWGACGGDIWACGSEPISHAGVTGTYIEAAARKTVRPAPAGQRAAGKAAP
jgi:hypothetical protein